MALNKAIMLLLEMRESSMMPTVFKVYINDIIKTVSQCEEPSAQPETNCSEFPNNSATISRTQAIDALRAMQTYKLGAGEDMLLIDQAEAQTELMMLPPAKPERPKGEWIHQVKFSRVECDQCGKVFRNSFAPKNFCPNCGADMRGDKHETD